jgi:hypothetical protein
MMFRFVNTRDQDVYINLSLVRKITVTSVGLTSTSVIFTYSTGEVESHVLTNKEFTILEKMITPLELNEVSWNTTLSGEKNDGG